MDKRNLTWGGALADDSTARVQAAGTGRCTCDRHKPKRSRGRSTERQKRTDQKGGQREFRVQEFGTQYEVLKEQAEGSGSRVEMLMRVIYSIVKQTSPFKINPRSTSKADTLNGTCADRFVLFLGHSRSISGWFDGTCASGTVRSFQEIPNVTKKNKRV